jgi:hypothetical protein
MTAALLCPGPSLVKVRVDDLAHYQIKIGVNRSVSEFECDWWAFKDYTVFPAVHPLGKPKIFTTVVCAETSALHGKPFYVNLTLDSIQDEFPPGGWPIYTSLCALTLAAHLGATQIDVYGADWTDAPDWDGVSLRSNERHADRWAQERMLWDQLCGQLNERGINVERVQV